MTESNRRAFLKQSSLSVAGAAAAALAADAARQARADDAPAAANDRPVVAIIGPGGMGTAHLNQLAGNKNVDLAYICEVDANRLATAVKTATDLSGREPKAVKDMREVFDDPAVDAVWIATPDHWHAPAAILAANAGKHVYVEKPCSHNLREGRLMVEAARRNNVVMQVGTQTRSTQFAIAAIEKLRSGVIGEILVAKAWNSQLRGNIGHAQPSDPPEYLDYDLWVGPAAWQPYQSNLLPGIWRWWHGFGCGDIGNDGVHDIDVARWGLAVDTHPTRVAALGGKSFFDDDQQWPDTQYVVYEYAGAASGGRPKQLIFEQRTWSPYVQEGHENGNAWYGTEGLMIFGKRGQYAIYGRRNQLIEEASGGGPDLAAHHANFLECIKSGARPNADIEINFLSSALCHLGNIATRTGRVLRFEPTNEQIYDDPEAAALLKREYRDHWATPAGV